MKPLFLGLFFLSGCVTVEEQCASQYDVDSSGHGNCIEREYRSNQLRASAMQNAYNVMYPAAKPQTNSETECRNVYGVIRCETKSH